MSGRQHGRARWLEFYGMNPTAVPPPLCFDRVRLVLCGTSHPGNIGAAARAAKTMGFSSLVLVSPKAAPDDRSVAMASGATDVLAGARSVATLAEALAGTTLAVAMTARRRELAVDPLWVRDAAALAATQLAGDFEGRDIAFVFGNETYGLSNDELALCAHWAMVPANPAYGSLNLGAAVQVVSYELRLALAEPGMPPAVPDAGTAASHEEVEGLLNQAERAAIESGFLDPASPKRLMPRLRRLAGRARLEREEVNILRGLLAALQRR